MIPSERFRANKAIDFDDWVKARKLGVTATEVAKASTPKGFEEVVGGYFEPVEIPDNRYMEFGRRSEGPISMWLKSAHDVMPNEWLIAANNPRHLATPDGLSLDHKVISEIKTTGRDFGDKIPVQYGRQIQWQIYVTGADFCWFTWMLRVETRDGDFQPGWIEPKVTKVLPSKDTIQDLIAVADKLWDIKRDSLGE